ncbi:MAG: type II toxin-antitoxin system VapC family toxin [Chloroflexi bacterium]|nr:type II toxin-antitoxin system VapC family toxin [Chloroflexota bacterium]
MAFVFLDTSGLVRRYDRSEPGGARVRAICAPSLRHTILLARLASVEFAAALNRKVREGVLPPLERNRHWQAFELHWRNQYQVVQVTEQIYDRAQHLTFAYPLRTLDALQLASALAGAARLAPHRLQFWTADAQQAAAARSEGLTIELLT